MDQNSLSCVFLEADNSKYITVSSKDKKNWERKKSFQNEKIYREVNYSDKVSAFLFWQNTIIKLNKLSPHPEKQYFSQINFHKHVLQS